MTSHHDEPSGEACTVDFEGKSIPARVGTPLMVTLLASGVEVASRSVKYHRPRGAFCLAGSCGQCWMRIDDLPNRPACTALVHPGMRATRENAFPSADVDVFRAADLVFPRGMDHHRLGTTPISPLNAIMQSTARRMAGLGSLSNRPPAAAPPLERRQVAVVVVGSGPAGLAAARETARAGLGTVVVESRERPGGQLRTRLFDDEPELMRLLPEVREALARSGGELWTSAVASGVYREDDSPSFELLVRRGAFGAEERLVLLRPRVMILANGGYEQCPLFEANDLPGHYGARALAELYLGYGVLPGERIVVADFGAEAGLRLHRALSMRGVAVERVAAPEAELLGARGGTHVKGVDVRKNGEMVRLGCDLLASAAAVAPAFELGRQAGCDLIHRPERGGFAVVAEPDTGATTARSIFAAGDVTGAKTALQAMLEGQRAGQSAASAAQEGA